VSSKYLDILIALSFPNFEQIQGALGLLKVVKMGVKWTGK
jgi:hypothetical protein